MPRRARTVTFTEASWQRFLGGLSTPPPFASLSISVVGEDGYHSAEAAEIWVRRFEEEPGWVRFTFWAPYRFTWRDVLYRYSWVTIIPPELAARLGGAATLTSSGAFVDVSELPGGSVWLRATRTIEEFDNARSSAVAEALAPVLVTAKVL